jgi:hypothetical protein
MPRLGVNRNEMLVKALKKRRIRDFPLRSFMAQA